jgi:hypothetical protein
MKKLIYIILPGVLMLLTLPPAFSQMQFYRYYSGPGGSYNLKNFSSQGFSFPNGANTFYYNGTTGNMNAMIQQLNRLMEEFFSSSQGYNNNFNNFNNFSYNNNFNPSMPEMNMYSDMMKPSQNPFMPQNEAIEQAPSFDQAPELYY